MSKIDYNRIIDSVPNEIYSKGVRAVAKEAMKEACRQVLEKASRRGLEKTESLFSEAYSSNGRLITPSLVEKEMKKAILSIKEEL